MSESIVHKWAMIFNLIIGVGFVAISMTALSHMKKACTNKIINNGINAILAMGAVMITLALVYFGCGTLDCYQMGSTQAGMIYLIATVITSVIVLGISGVMLRELNKNKNEDKCGKHTRNLVILLMVITIISGGVSGYTLVKTINFEQIEEDGETQQPRPRQPPREFGTLFPQQQ